MTITAAIAYEALSDLHTDILNELPYHELDILAITEGAGIYDEQPERCIIILVTLPQDAIPELRYRLATIAADHGQEAIGFIHAPSTETLITAHAT